MNRYNGYGQRIQKTEGGKETNYYYQDTTVVATTDGEKALTSHHLLGEGNDIITSGRYVKGDNDSYFFYHQGYRNSTTTILDSEGKEVQSYRYGNFGETKSRGSKDFSNEVCYTGGIYDSSTGLYYLNARYYDPAYGRFLTRDTYRGEKENAASMHLYTYCENDPVNKIDPSGHLAVFSYYHVASQANMNHHIVAQGASAAEYSRKILNQVGVGIHSGTNKVSVKYNLHRHLHTNSYHNTVRALIQTAYIKGVNKRNAVIATLYYIRAILLSANRVTP